MAIFFTKPRPGIFSYLFLCFLALLCVGKTWAQSAPEWIKNDNANPLRHFMVVSGRQSQPVFVDIDNDGDKDCFSGEFNYSKNGLVNSHISFFKNEGDAKHPSFKEITNAENPLSAIAITGLIIPAFADIDGDGDQDCFIADNAGAITFYKNTGTATLPKFEKQSAAFNPLSAVKFMNIDISNFILGDADADGDIDCLVTDKDGNEAYFRNTGSLAAPKFVNISQSNDPFAFIKNTTVNNISFYDWNKDNRNDMFVNGNYHQNNMGYFSATSFSSAINNDDDIATSWVDLNNDGTPEIISGTSDGKFTYSTSVSTNAKVVLYVSVSPNPTTKNFTVYFPSSNEKRTLKVVNADGKTMLSQSVNAGSFTFGDNFIQGTYFVQLISSGSKIAEQRIIKL